MRISSVKPAPWLAVNLHHLFLNGAEFNTQSCRSLTSYAILCSYRRRFICDNESDIASLVSDLRLGVLNAALFENRWWRFTANQGAGFTDEMRMHIAWDISPSPTLVTLKTLISLLFVNYWHIKQDYIFNMNEYEHEYELINCIHISCIFLFFCWIVKNYFIFIIKRFVQELTVNCKHWFGLHWKCSINSVKL